MIRVYTMRLKTTSNQKRLLETTLAQLCELYNMALQQRRDVWRSHHEYLSFYDQCKQLTELRNGVEEYAQGTLKIQRDPLRRVDRAFKAFFRRVKSGGAPGFPRFRSQFRYDSFTVGRESFVYENACVRIVKMGTFRTKTGCRIKGEPIELRIKRSGNKWIAQVVCELGKAPSKVAVSEAVGIDLGITSLATLSDGTSIDNPRWTQQEENLLARANRNLATKRRSSKNWNKSRERLRRVHQRIAGKRTSYLISIAKQLIRKYDLIAHEDLNVNNMVRSKFAKSILDAAWGKLIWILQCEAEKAGKWIIPVNPRNTTKTCSDCGELVPKKLWQRQHICPKCGLSLKRDHNAALNILRLGKSLALTAEFVEN